MNKHNRLFYFCAINTKEYEQVVNQQLHIGAATNKVLSVVAALRSIDCPAYAISLPVLRRSPKIRFVRAKLLRESKRPIIFLPVVSNPILRRLLGTVCFAGFCCFHLKPHDKVLLYNYSPEYLLAVLILKLRGNPAIIDIEDAPHNKTTNLREKINQYIYRVSLALCQNRYITVSIQVAKDFKLNPFCVIYGAVNELYSQNINLSNEENTFRVLYGGTICDDTGLQLFCDTVDFLSKSTIQSNLDLVFVVTGFGGEEQIKKLQSHIGTSQIRIEQKSNLTFNEYQVVFRSCRAALCLKIPDSEIGVTTFPSKVVEITSAGLLLISTKVSDIPILFDDENAILLDKATPKKLCEAILWALENQEECKNRSIRGQSRAIELFAENHVGNKIWDFIFQ